MGLLGVYRRWQERRRERIATEYGNLSEAERAELAELRAQHDPLHEMSRVRGPAQFWDGDSRR